MITNALSIDLEEYFHVSNFERLLDRESWASLPSRVVASTHKLLDAFDETGNRQQANRPGRLLDRQITGTGHNTHQQESRVEHLQSAFLAMVDDEQEAST